MDKKSTEKTSVLLKAYRTLLFAMKNSVEKCVGAEHKFAEHLARAKRELIELEHLTEEEAQKLVQYLERDMHDAAHFLSDAKKCLSDWLYFDCKLIESTFWNAFTKVADKTALEYQQFKLDLRHGLTYHTDEIIGLGTLKCQSCDNVLHFQEISVIPACPKCQQTTFVRV